MPAATEREIVTPKELADYLRATGRSIDRLAGAKKIPKFTGGETWRFSRTDIDEWIKRHSSARSDDPAGNPG